MAKKLDKPHQAWAKIVAKAWNDEVFKQRVIKHPDEVFREYGVEPLQGVHIKDHVDTPTESHLVIHQKPTGQFSEEELRKIAGGGDTTAACNCHHIQN